MVDRERKYATLSWDIEDIQTVRPDLTDAQVEAFLQNNERHIRERLCELGWEVIETLLDMDDDVPARRAVCECGWSADDDTGHEAWCPLARAEGSE